MQDHASRCLSDQTSKAISGILDRANNRNAHECTKDELSIPPGGPSPMSTYKNSIATEDGPAEPGLSQSLYPLRSDQGVPPIIDGGIDSRRGGVGTSDMMNTGWDQIWTDFFDAVPELDMSQ
ncbi:hypothetical protein PG991_007369 [Apiospora marii]|uniref:Uncharacterized protein n=1 Tax=Apiospora marii TaxID=335849 RepID=A0ABR1RT87_9PEZI